MFLRKARHLPIKMLLYQGAECSVYKQKPFNKNKSILLEVPSTLSPYSMPKALNIGYMLKKHWCLAPSPKTLIEWSKVLDDLGFGISKCSTGDSNEHGNLCSMPSFSHGNERVTQDMTAWTFSYPSRTELMVSEWAFIFTSQFRACCLTFLHVLDTVQAWPDSTGLLLFLCTSPLASVCFFFCTTPMSFFGGLPNIYWSHFGHKYIEQEMPGSSSLFEEALGQWLTAAAKESPVLLPPIRINWGKIK